MRVLRLASAFEPPAGALAPEHVRFNPVGGMQNHVANLTRGLDRLGVVQDVVTTRPPTAPHLERVGARARVVRLGLPGVTRHRQGYAVPLAAVAPVLGARADLVHAHFSIDMGLIPVAMGVAAAYRLPLVVTLHSSLRHTLPDDSPRAARLIRYGGAVERWVTGRAAAVISLTPRLRGLLVGDGLPAAKVHVIPSGVDPERFAGPFADPLPGVPHPRVAFVGRVEHEKGPDVLLRAAAQVPGLHVVVVGDGAMRGELVALAASLGIAGRVTFTGYVPNTAVPAVLAHCDLFAMPSRFEELGTACVEALHTGLPIVASDTGGIPVEDGVDGLRVPPGDPGALADALRRLLGDGALAARLGEAAAARARRDHAWPALAERVLGVYRGVTARDPG
jgi:glycosyltransferase involved in cell wall biosynthesis